MTNAETLEVPRSKGRHSAAEPAPTGTEFASWALYAIVAIDVVIGVAYRFITTSKMWLDEAQSVNIARLPVSQIPGALRRDGAPPLYYVLLHFWIGIVGNSDAAIRSLSGLFAVLALPLLWWVVRHGYGKTEALAALAVLAASPFAVYYATEARMYSLIVLLVIAGLGAVQALMARPTVPRALLLAVVAALLLYTHYWSLYLLAVVGVWLVYVSVRSSGERRRSGIYGIAALVLAGISFVPWVPSFLYQRAHTGTPWAAAPTLASAYGWLAGFVINQNIQDTNLSLHIELGLVLLILLLAFGFAARPAGRDRLEFRLTGQPRARVLGFIAVGTLVVGWIASRAAGTAFQPRYSSVVFPIIVVLVALGVAALPTRWLQVGALAIASVAALWTVHWGAHAQRTQAGKVATVLHAAVPAGAVVVVCPDQLGPSLLRYAGSTRYEYIGYPRFNSPLLVNWVDYKRAVQQATLSVFAHRVTALAGSAPFYLVWSKGYGFHAVCSDFATELSTVSGRTPQTLVVARKYVYYQAMNLLKYPPPP